jgi:hypothetical protein
MRFRRSIRQLEGVNQPIEGGNQPLEGVNQPLVKGEAYLEGRLVTGGVLFEVVGRQFFFLAT